MITFRFTTCFCFSTKIIAGSPDLNVIENLWSILDEAVYIYPYPRTIDELKTRLKHAWENIKIKTLENLAKSMRHRINVCLACNGGYTGY